MGAFRHAADFTVDGETVDAWLFRPAREADGAPTVVMAHGLGGEKAWRLEPFARAFADRGIASLVFDYRGFGDSEGTPRHVVSPAGQVADWRAAVAHARGHPKTGDRVALWSWSLGAGHAVTVAASEPVAAVVAQYPFVDGRRTALGYVRRGGARWAAWAVLSALRDLTRKLPFRSPLYVPIAGEPDERAIVAAEGVLEGYASLVPDDGDLPNECAARFVLASMRYRPVSDAGNVECPVLVIQAEEDSVVPAGPIERLVADLDDVERVRRPGDHFGVFHGAGFEWAAEREGDFLERHLLGD